MAETVRVEIPITATDNTASGVSSAQRRLTSLDRSLEKTKKQLDRLSDSRCRVDIEASNSASNEIAKVEDDVQRLAGTETQVEIGAEDNATQVVHGAEDAVENLDGQSGSADIGAEDNATQVIREAEDAVENFGGQSGSADIGAEDNATQVIHAAEDAVEDFDGRSGSVEIGAEDNATQVIRSVQDAAEALGGMSVMIDIGVNDGASEVISSIQDGLAGLGQNQYGVSGGGGFGSGGGSSGGGGGITKGGGILSGIGGMLAAAGAAAGIGGTMGSSLDTFMSFESEMSKVSAISSTTGSELDTLTEKAKEMGATTKFTATEAAEAMNYMAMAGWKSSDMMSGIDGIMDLAAASGTNLGTTSDIVTDALTAFGLKADQAGRFSDVLAQASANANTNVSMMGESFKYVAPVAGGMSYSIEDTALALGLMANSSIKGSMAGTALKTAISNMVKPTDEMTGVMDKYGISLTDSEGNMKTLKEVIEDMRENLGGLSEMEQNAAASALFGKEAMAGMLAIINAAPEDYEKLETAIENSSGAAEQMSETMLDNLLGSLTLMSSAIDGVKNSFGERLAPYVAGAADLITAAMPAVEAALNGLMDFVDETASGIKRSIDSMMDSEEWQNADLFGKIDIAWDTIIAEPFMKWAGGKGKNLLSQGLGKLFSSASAILPGGEEAGLTSWLSAGLLGAGAGKIISGAGSIVEALRPVGDVISSIADAARSADSIGGFLGSIGDMVPLGAKVGIAAAAITAAVAAIKTAVDSYNSITLSNNLEEHFGSIELNPEEAAGLAEQIIPAKWTVNVDLALGELEHAEQVRAQAEDALNTMEKLTWKSSLGITLDQAEADEFLSAADTFVESKIDELESDTYAAKINAEVYLGNTKEGEDLSQKITDWATADFAEMDDLSSKISESVSKAIEDGIIDADEQAAISALQEKMNSITEQWYASQSEAQMDLIKEKYGSMSAEELTEGGYRNLMGALNERNETLDTKAEEGYTATMANLHTMHENGRITDEEFASYKEAADRSLLNQTASGHAQSMDIGVDTISNAYAEKLEQNGQAMDQAMDQAMENMQGRLNMGQMGLFAGELENNAQLLNMGNGKGAFGKTKDESQAGLNSLVDSLAPDASALGSLMDRYAEAGQAVPEAVKESYYNAMELMASSGDSDASMQAFAHRIAESGNQSLIDAMNEAYSNGSLTEGMSTAWRRATQETGDEELEVDSPKLKLNSDVEFENKDAWLKEIEGMEAVGTEEIDGEMYVNYKVKPGNTLSGIAEENGLSLDQILEDNPEITNPDEIDVDQTIRIRASEVTMDSTEMEAAMDEAVASLSAEGTAMEVTTEGVKVTMGEVEVDPADTLAKIAAAVGTTVEALEGAGITEETITTGATVTIPQELVTVETEGLNSAIESAMSGENAEGGTVSGSADVDVEAGTVDPSGAYETAQTETQAAFDETMPTDGHADVTLDQTNNADVIYGETADEVRNTYSTPISATATVNVTLDWNILNPNYSIAVSGSGSGSGELHAAGSAEGRFVDEPMLSWIGEDGPEFVIPVGSKRRTRGIELWQQAGEALGIEGYADGGAAGIDSMDDMDEEAMTATPFEKAKETQNQALEGAFRANTINTTPQTFNALPRASEGSQGANNTDTTNNNGVQVTVNMNPVIQIDGGGNDEDEIFEILKSRIKEVADDIGYEVGINLTKIFENTPITSEV